MTKRLLIAVTIAAWLLVVLAVLDMSEHRAQAKREITQSVLRLNLDGHDYLLLPGKCFTHSASCATCTGQPLEQLLMIQDKGQQDSIK